MDLGFNALFAFAGLADFLAETLPFLALATLATFAVHLAPFAFLEGLHLAVGGHTVAVGGQHSVSGGQLALAGPFLIGTFLNSRWISLDSLIANNSSFRI